MILFFILSCILLIFSPMIFYSSSKGLKNLHRWVRDKIIKKRENIFRYFYSTLFWLYLVNFIFLVFDANILNRLILSFTLVVVLTVINSFPLALFLSFIFPLEVLSILVKKLKPKRKGKNKGNKEQDWGQKFSKRFSSASRLKLSTIIIYSVILLSFSFDIIINKYNYWWIALILAFMIIFYLLTALINIFKAQKDMIYLSDRLEASGDVINSIKDNNIFNFSKHLINGFIKSYSKPPDTNLSVIDKAINWAKKNFNKVQFVSKMGVAVFRSLLTIKLIMIIITSLLFYIVVTGNYLVSLDQIGMLSQKFSYHTEYYLTAFYLFMGESISFYTNSSDSSFFAGFTLFLGMSSWLLSVTYIVLYFDIMNLSSSDFNQAVNNSIVTIYREINKIMEEMSDQKPDQDLLSIVEALKVDKNILKNDPETASKLKSIFDNLGKSNDQTHSTEK